jgi:hypothetical protein
MQVRAGAARTLLLGVLALAVLVVAALRVQEVPAAVLHKAVWVLRCKVRVKHSITGSKMTFG